MFAALFSRVVAQCVSAGLVDGTKIHVDTSLIDAHASFNSVRDLDAATLDQIQQACLEQTQKLEEADCPKNETDLADAAVPATSRRVVTPNSSSE